MSEMVERVALAIPGSNDSTNILSIHRDRARLAIEAMREPTDEMIEGGSQIEGVSPAKRIWHTMIDEALK